MIAFTRSICLFSDISEAANNKDTNIQLSSQLNVSSKFILFYFMFNNYKIDATYRNYLSSCNRYQHHLTFAVCISFANAFLFHISSTKEPSQFSFSFFIVFR